MAVSSRQLHFRQRTPLTCDSLPGPMVMSKSAGTAELTFRKTPKVSQHACHGGQFDLDSVPLQASLASSGGPLGG